MSTPWVLSNDSRAATVLGGPQTVLVLLSLVVTLALIVVRTIIDFLCVYSKAFRVDSSASYLLDVSYYVPLVSV